MIEANYQVTTETAGFIEALRKLEGLENACCTALCRFYGEKEGDRIFAEDLPLFDAVRGRIAGYLSLSIADNFADLTTGSDVI